MWGGRFLSFLSTGDIPKSAEVGGKHGAVQCKAAAGFLPVHRCRSPHIHLIQSHRHQMPQECQTQSLKRQEAQRKKHKQKHNKRRYTLEKSTSVSKCKCYQDWKDGWYKKISLMSCVYKQKWYGFIYVQRYQAWFCITATEFMAEDSYQLYRIASG